MSTTPLRTAMPDKAINPKPAEMLNGKPLRIRPRTPPTKAKGTHKKINTVSLTFLKILKIATPFDKITGGHFYLCFNRLLGFIHKTFGVPSTRVDQNGGPAFGIF